MTHPAPFEQIPIFDWSDAIRRNKAIIEPTVNQKKKKLSSVIRQRKALLALRVDKARDYFILPDGLIIELLAGKDQIMNKKYVPVKIQQNLRFYWRNRSYLLDAGYIIAHYDPKKETITCQLREFQLPQLSLSLSAIYKMTQYLRIDFVHLQFAIDVSRNSFGGPILILTPEGLKQYIRRVTFF